MDEVTCTACGATQWAAPDCEACGQPLHDVLEDAEQAE